MAGIEEKQDANEQALVKSMPDEVMRLFLPAGFPDARSPSALQSFPTTTITERNLRDIFYGWLTKISVSLAQAAQRDIARGLFFLLLPVFAAFGSIVYFTLPFEPDWPPILALLTGFALLRVLSRKHYLICQGITLLIAFQLGLTAGKFETWRHSTPVLGSDVATRITGRVTGLEYRENGSWRVTLDLLSTERPKLRHAPKRIRITSRDIPASTMIGSGLTGFARLRVPSGPVRPGNYDFAFHAYFDEIGANGFFLGTPKSVTVPAKEGWSSQISDWIAQLRSSMSERIYEALPGEDGSVAAALIAGERAGISEETNENLRKAGLAHILSISGLHMALAAGVMMMCLRAVFALFPAYSARYPVKKYAAILSLASCTFYLAMSGSDVAAQRSYIMIAVMLGALLFDRAAISMRNLAISAIVMIAISPHAILGPSFQMSFSATAALIAAFGWWSDRNIRRMSVVEKRRESPSASYRPWYLRITAPIIATACTSVVAGVASGIFAAYHFNNTAPFGLLGNVLALPVISMLVMPFAVFSLILMPFQLDWLPLQVMGNGIWLVRLVARFVAGFSPDGNPGAIPPASLVLWTIALIIAVVFTTYYRALAFVFVVAGLIVFMRTPMPDIIISEDARLVGVRLPDGRLAINRSRAPKFIAENWRTAYLLKEFVPPSRMDGGNDQNDDNRFDCETGVCSIQLRDGRMLAYVTDTNMMDVACNIGDVVILAIAGKALQCPRADKLLISQRDLALRGAVEIRLGTAFPVNEIHVEQNYAIGIPARPWQLHRLYSKAARGKEDRPYGKPAENKMTQ